MKDGVSYTHQREKRKTKMNNYLFDMDGVLFDWVEAFEALYGDVANYTIEEMKKIKAEIAKTDFYKNLTPLKEGFELFEHCKALGSVAILTSVGKYDSEKVIADKKEALMKALGYVPEFLYTTSSADKAKYVSKGVLFDDRVKSVNPFRMAGGKAILYTGKENAIKELRSL